MKSFYKSHGNGEFDISKFKNTIVFEEGVKIFNEDNISIDNDCYIGHNSFINGYNELKIGKRCWIGPQVYIHSAGKIYIGNSVGIGPGVKMISSSHELSLYPKPILDSKLIFDRIEIGDGSDIGTNATILPGTKLGKNTQVGAGAVVKGIFPDNVVLTGVPAKIKKYIINSVEYFDYSKVIENKVCLILNKIENVLVNDRVILGKDVKVLEDKIKEKHNIEYCIGTSSGTDALLVLLLSLELKKKEVIVPTFTFGATIESIILAGLKPVIIDIEENDFHINVDEIEKNITENTGAILFVHLFGELKDITKIKDIASKNNIYLLEDSAQAFGSFNNKYYSGFQSDAATFSFFPNKSLGTAGDGGAIITNNKSIYNKCICIRNHGCEEKYKHKYVGGTFRLNTIQASILNILIEDFDKNKNQRLYNFKLYYKNLCKIDKIKLPCINEGHTLSVMTIICEKRDELFIFLKNNNIETFKYWPEGMHKQYAFKKYANNEYKNCNILCRNVLSLPIYHLLTEEKINYVSNKIKEFYENDQ